MRVDEYAVHDAIGLARLVREGEVSAEEVYAAAMAAIEAVDPQINAMADGPWREPISNTSGGKFAGVPIALKDIGGHGNGISVRSGSRLSGTGLIAPNDGFLTTRIRELGFAIAGLTTTPEFGYNVSCESVIYGPTRNPWDLGLSAGGSSGGAAAIVAAGGVPVGHGGDGGGSIRIPASCNGVVGLKPSRGRVSYGPGDQEVAFGFGHDFVLTRSLRDTAAVLDGMAGPMPGEKYVIKEPTRPWLDELGRNPGKLRVAITTSPWSDVPVDAEVKASVERVGHELERLGHEVDEARPGLDWEEFIPAQVTLFSAWNAEAVERTAEAAGVEPSPENLEQAILASWEHGMKMTARELVLAQNVMNRVSRRVGQFFTDWDLLVTPTMNTLPVELGYANADDHGLGVEEWARRIFGFCSFTPLFNWTGQPAMSLPLGQSGSGVPIGVQLVADMCEEAMLFQVGSQLEKSMPWSGRVPAVHATRAGSQAQA